VKPGGGFDRFGQRIAELEEKSAEAGFWNDAVAAEKAMSELKGLKNRYEPWKELCVEVDDLEILHQLSF